MITFDVDSVLLQTEEKIIREIKRIYHTHRCMKNDRYAKKHPVPMSSRNRIFSYIYGCLIEDE